MRFLSAFLLAILLTASGCGDLQSLLKGKTAAVTAETPAEPSKSSRSRSLSGTYNVRGTNPGGRGNYAGTATITDTGPDTVRIDWKVGNIYTGTGQRVGDVLSVEWGDGTNVVGTVKYNVESDGRLTGTWYTKDAPNNLGSEILLPQGR